ncbi:MAG: imidazolonepropionase [Micrococcales bacterium]
MAKLFGNIGQLVVGVPPETGELELIENAALVVDAGVVAWVGSSASAPAADELVDVAGRTVIPGFVDSHAHLIFAGDRAAEFEARMSGVSYSAGGIKTTVAATRAASDDDLRAGLRARMHELHRSGITTFETKSGYGLNVADEARSVALAAEVTDEVTFLGAHVVPAEFADRREDYVSLVAGEMLEAAAPHSRWIDVFCDRGAFDADEADEILRAGVRAGLRPRIHANQLEAGAGIELAVKHDCASADHCTHLTDRDIELLAGSNTVATLLPGAEFSTRAEYPDARRLFAAGAKVALATDCNPGTSFTTSMAFCLAVAVRDMHFTPSQALAAATAGGASALRRTDVGGLRVGQCANLVVLDAPSFVHLMYRPGVDLVDATYIDGSPIYEREK